MSYSKGFATIGGLKSFSLYLLYLTMETAVLNEILGFVGDLRYFLGITKASGKRANATDLSFEKRLPEIFR